MSEPTPEPPSSPPAPDLRILQANERTFLAWIRTALGLVVVGFGLTRLTTWFESDSPMNTPWAFPLGIAFAVLGLALIPLAAWRHVRIFNALCADEPVLPKPFITIGLSVLLVALILILLAFIAVDGP